MQTVRRPDPRSQEGVLYALSMDGRCVDKPAPVAGGSLPTSTSVRWSVHLFVLVYHGWCDAVTGAVRVMDRQTIVPQKVDRPPPLGSS